MSLWRHQMETFFALLALCAVNSPVIGEFPSQRPVMWSFNFFLDLCLNKRLSRQSWRGYFRRHRAHYDVIVMLHVIYHNLHVADYGDICQIWRDSINSTNTFAIYKVTTNDETNTRSFNKPYSWLAWASCQRIWVIPWLWLFPREINSILPNHSSGLN